MYGLTFRGKHSYNDMGAAWKTTKRPFLPIPKITVENLPEVDGSYDFSEANEDGRLHYEDRVFEGVITVKASNMTTLQIQLTRIARWLHGGFSDLMFDDMPGTVWTARVENPDQISYELGKVGSATVMFRVQPFSKAIFSSAGNITLDAPIMLDSEIPLDWDTADYTIAFDSSTEFTINNLGDWHTKPRLIITGEFVNIIIASGDRSFAYTGGCGVSDEIIIDFKTQTVTKNGSNDTVYSTGTPWELPAGENTFTITSTGTAPSGSITFDMNFYFVNGAVFD